MKYINNNSNDRIKNKINEIRIALIKPGNIITKSDRDTIRKELYDIENKQNLTNKQKKQKETVYNRLTELAIALDKIKKYKYQNFYDLDYIGMRDIQNLFNNIGDYYKPISIKSSFNNNYEYYKIRGDKNKNLSINEHLYMIIPKLTKLINNKKNNNEPEIQLSMGINFMHATDRDKNRTFHVKSDNVEIRLSNDANNIITKLLDSFLNNYQEEEQILRNASNYTFESEDILGIHFHNIKLRKRQLIH